MGDLSPAELSGGMQKRVALARAIAAQPDIMFFDEPTTGLDPIMGAVIDGLIVDCVKRLGSTAIAITHDMASARRIGDQAGMLLDGRIVWAGPASHLLDSGKPGGRSVHPRAARRPDPDGAAALNRRCRPTAPACCGFTRGPLAGRPSDRLRPVRRLPAVSAWALISLAWTFPALAASGAAPQFTGLFMQSCLSFAGNPADLRAWASRTGLPAVPEPGRRAFLHGAPGQAFDGSSDAGKFVIVSADDGLCSVVAEQAVQQAAIDALEGDLRQAGIAFRLVIERDDPAIPAIHDREYLATRNGRSWRILLATVKGDKAGQAMLTTAPE